mmetsp:Transcript_27378/g.38447  ORF Transcript_27378/g.38447 Transcript_27378/m.38447 type:complete len:386 (-) Transcript_27378:42-1199(-)
MKAIVFAIVCVFCISAQMQGPPTGAMGNGPMGTPMGMSPQQQFALAFFNKLGLTTDLMGISMCVMGKPQYQAVGTQFAQAFMSDNFTAIGDAFDTLETELSALYTTCPDYATLVNYFSPLLVAINNSPVTVEGVAAANLEANAKRSEKLAMIILDPASMNFTAKGAAAASLFKIMFSNYISNTASPLVYDMMNQFNNSVPSYSYSEEESDNFSSDDFSDDNTMTQFPSQSVYQNQQQYMDPEGLIIQGFYEGLGLLQDIQGAQNCTQNDPTLMMAGMGLGAGLKQGNFTMVEQSWDAVEAGLEALYSSCADFKDIIDYFAPLLDAMNNSLAKVEDAVVDNVTDNLATVEKQYGKLLRDYQSGSFEKVGKDLAAIFQTVFQNYLNQ